MLRHIIDRQHGHLNNNVLYPLAKGNESFLQRMSLLQSMEVHRGCVNTVVWDRPGNLLLSGSDDQQLVICDPWERMTKMRIHTAHRANIFSAKFMPHTANRKIVSCSGDGIVIYTDVERQEETHDCKFTCHYSTCYDVVTLPDDPHTFLTCGEDDCVRWFDLRIKTKCSVQECREDILLSMGRPVTAVAVNPVTSYHLAVATQDSTIRIYDRRILGTRALDTYLEQSDRALLMQLQPDGMEGKSHRVTSLRYSADGQDVLASYSSDFIYLFDTQTLKETSLKVKVDDSETEVNSGPTLKRLRLRGDWSDTGPQALPEREMRSQAGDVGQARPTLHATLMQRMTDVLSRMLNDPNSRSSGGAGEAPQIPPDPREEGEREAAAAAGGGDGDNSGTAESSSTATTTTGTLANTTEETATADCQQQHSAALDAAQQGSQRSGNEDEDGNNNDELQDQIVSSDDDCDDEEMNEERSSSPPPAVSTTDGLQNQITSLRRGFVRKHNVEPSVNLSYSGHGVTSNMISLGVGDEVSRGCNSDEDTNNTSQQQTEDADSKTHCDTTTATTTPPSPPSHFSPIHTPSTSSPLSHTDAPPPPSSPSPHTDLTKPQTTTANTAVCPDSTEVTTANQTHGGDGDGDGGDGASSSQATTHTDFTIGPSLDFVDDDDDDDDDDDSDDDDDDNESMNTRSANARMASEIERAVLQARESHDAGGGSGGAGEESEITVPQAAVRQCYKGHRNARTMIKEACFWGDTHVMSGSDCGRVFVWERKTGRLVMLWEADRHVVNCLQPHPTLPVLATSGIDYDVKLWAPLCVESYFDEAKAKEITQRNEALLEETRDTITVPAAFMIRMLASLNQLRRGSSFAERWRNRRQARRHGEEEDHGGTND